MCQRGILCTRQFVTAEARAQESASQSVLLGTRESIASVIWDGAKESGLEGLLLGTTAPEMSVLEGRDNKSAPENILLGTTTAGY